MTHYIGRLHNGGGNIKEPFKSIFPNRTQLAGLAAMLMVSFLASNSQAQIAQQASINQGGNPTAIIFSNQTAANVAAYWVDLQGVYQPVGFLLPNQAIQINTYPGHLTVFISNNQVVASFRAAVANQLAYAIMGSGNTGSNLLSQNSGNSSLTNLLSAALVNAATQNTNTGVLNNSTTANNPSSLSNILAAANTSNSPIANNPLNTRNSSSGLGNLLSSLANGFLPRRNTNTSAANNATGTNSNSALNSILAALTNGTATPNNNTTTTANTGTNTSNSGQLFRKEAESAFETTRGFLCNDFQSPLETSVGITCYAVRSSYHWVLKTGVLERADSYN